MSNESERGTGRTTKLLVDAINLALAGKKVYTIWPHMNHIDYSMRLLIRLLGDRKVAFALDTNMNKRRVHIGDGYILLTTFRDSGLDLDSGRIRGVSKDTPILVDHSVYEDRR